MPPDVSCEHCGDLFPVERSSEGGIVNCPACGKATVVPGLRDPLWRLVQAGIVLAAVLALALGATSGSPLQGALAGSGVLALGWLVTRAL